MTSVSTSTHGAYPSSRKTSTAPSWGSDDRVCKSLALPAECPPPVTESPGDRQGDHADRGGDARCRACARSSSPACCACPAWSSSSRRGRCSGPRSPTCSTCRSTTSGSSSSSRSACRSSSSTADSGSRVRVLRRVALGLGLLAIPGVVITCVVTGRRRRRRVRPVRARGSPHRGGARSDRSLRS